MSYEDILASKKVHIMMDVISREGFDFSVIELHTLLGEHRQHLTSHIYRLRAEYSSERSEFFGCGLLFWGCSSGGGGVQASRIFAARVYDYYECIGDFEYYRRLIDELR